MSSQPREEDQAQRPAFLEGEVQGPNYGAADQIREVPRPAMLNGVQSPSRVSSEDLRGRGRPSLSGIVPARGEGASSGDVGTSTAQPPRQLQQASAVQQQQPQQVPAVQRQPQQVPAVQQQPQQVPSVQQRQPQQVPSVQQRQPQQVPAVQRQPQQVSAVQLRSQQAGETRSHAVQVPTRPEVAGQQEDLQVEVHSEVHMRTVDGPHSPMSTTQVPGDNTARPTAWFARVTEVLQRRVVNPVLEQVNATGMGRVMTQPEASPATAWYSQPVTPSGPGQLMSPEVRQAMSAWTARTSAITPRRPEAPQPNQEESSNASLTQEVMMEEVRKQVRLALNERESEVQRLSAENNELKQVILALTAPEVSLQESGGRGIRQGTDGAAGLRGRDLEGDPAAERRGVRGPLGDPAALRELPNGSAGVGQGGGDLGPPPGLPHHPTVSGSNAGTNEREGGNFRREAMSSTLHEPMTGHEARQGDDHEPRRGHRSGMDGEGGTHLENPKGPAGEAPTTEDSAMVDHLHLLVQGMRQLQQMQMSRKDPSESEAMKGSVELPKMPDLGDAAVEFNDWIYVTEQMLGALTDSASGWFSMCLACAREAYARYQGASALERLSIEPALPEALKDAKWYRLERRVLSLLLASMTKGVREDTITHRVDSVAGVLYRLHVLYQPGGTSERTMILKHLEGAPSTEDPSDAVTQLRRWKRHLTRAEEMAISLPDASLQLKGIETIISRAVERLPDVKFRLALAKNELNLASAPNSEAVAKFYPHALAELQQVTGPDKRTQDTARVKGLTATTTQGPGTGGSTTPTASPKKGKNPCKFFTTEAGCKRGLACQYSHEFLSKADRKQRCWTCGSTTHRQQDCPTTAGTQKGGRRSQESTATAASSATTPATASSPTLARTAANEPEIPASSTSTSNNEAPAVNQPATSSTTSMDEGSSHREEMKKLLREANSMLSKIKLMKMKTDETNQATEDLELLLRSAGLDQHGLALLDNGASHPFRGAVDEEERRRAKPVKVELADGRSIDLRQTSTGTLLKEDRRDPQPPIVPLGSLVQQLGCSLTWSKKGGLKVSHPVHGPLEVKMHGNCPMIAETEALRLISEIEDRNLQALQQATARSLWSPTSFDNKPWDISLETFAATGVRTYALSAMMDPAFPITVENETERYDFVGPMNLDLTDKAGEWYLKSLPVNRKMRRRLLTTRWMVHLFDGNNDETTNVFKRAESDSVTYLEIDIQKSKAYNMKGWSNVLRALLWAACRGQLDGIMGGPPKDETGELKKKLMFLWMVAEKGAVVNDLRKPFLFMELGEKSGWWNSEDWNRLKREYLLTVSRVQGDDTVVYHAATNLNLIDYNGQEESATGQHGTLSKWTSSLATILAQSIEVWWKRPDQVRLAQLLCAMDGPLSGMSEKELKRWARHVRDGHVPFDKRCKTCVSNAASGRPHRRVLTPSAYTLSVDVAGPFRVKGVDADGKYRYALVGSYCMPLILDDDDDYLREAEEVDPPLPPEDLVELEEKNREYKKFYEEVFKEVGETMEFQSLLYVVPLKSRLKVDVNVAVRRLYLELRQEGHPVARVHSDRARELKSASLRQWLYEKDVWVTTGESQTPQQNGRAEAAVKAAKKYAKVLLGASSLPRECWPLAMTYAAKRQRRRALGQTTKEPTFGAKVLVKAKVFGTGGAYDLDPRWREGRFVGYSSDVRNGLVVRYEDGSFATSCQVRGDLVDADAVVDDAPLRMDLPVPSRRVRAKTRLATLKMLFDEVETMAQDMDVNEMYDVDDILRLWEKLRVLPMPTRKSAKATLMTETAGSFYAGSYVHGGLCGVMKMTRKLPNTTAYLIKAAKEITGTHSFGSVAIVEDVSMGPHKDNHNQRGTMNTVTALSEFNGGQVWVEKDEDEFELEDEWRQVKEGLWKRGAGHELKKGDTVEFSPGKWHQTEAWTGRRVTLLTYTPRLSNLSEKDAGDLRSLGFDLPVTSADAEEEGDHDRSGETIGSMFQPSLDAIHQSDSDPGEEWVSSLSRLTEEQNDLIEELQERSLRLRRLLEEEEILREEYRRMGRQVNDEADNAHQMLVDLIEQTGDTMLEAEADVQQSCLRSAIVTDNEESGIDDVERYLQGLTEELEVVLNVPLEQVKRNITVWIPAIDKELATLFKNGKGGTLRSIPMSEARAREARGELTIVPSKLVFTVKPPAQGALKNDNTKGGAKTNKPKWRRKCRLVLCGNFASRPEGQSQADLYAAGATADSMRTALAIASACLWAGAGSDINGAFLLAPWPQHMRRYAIVPPKTLVAAGLASESEAYEVDRALYGLRESPAVWSDFRRQRLKAAHVPWRDGHVILKPSVVDPEVWMILYVVEGQVDLLVGVLVTYVDDLLYLAERELIEALHSWLCEEWPSSPLEWTTTGTRYLGVEIKQDETGVFFISQKGYLENLVRSYDLEPGAHVRLPCPREWLLDEDVPSGELEEYTEEELRRAQKIVGELLWVTRSRPDTLFIVGMMASALTKRPCHVYRIGLKVVAYLAASIDVQLQLGGRAPTEQHTSNNTAAAAPSHTSANLGLVLEGYSDASFAPFGGRSYGASVVALSGSVVSWKCARQAFTTMSVAEAELYEAAQTTLLMQGTSALIEEILGRRIPQALLIDNSASVSLIHCCQGSWRTRHLKVRCSFISDLVQQGVMLVKHVNGEDQWADMPTKLHSKARMVSLMKKWGFTNLPVVTDDKTKLAMLLTLIVALQAQPAAAESQKTVSLAGWDELTVVTLLVCIAAVAIWELVKKCLLYTFGVREESQRERRLRRLREAARAAAEEELDRETFKRELDVERRPIRASQGSDGPRLRTSATQTPPLQMPEPRVETRVVYTPGPPLEAPYDVPVNMFYKTNDYRSRIHTTRECHGLRNAGTVYAAEYCQYCEGRRPLRTRNP
eukprot:s732_g5.t1